MTDAVAPFTDAEPRHEEGTTGSYLDAHGSGFSEGCSRPTTSASRFSTPR